MLVKMLIYCVSSRDSKHLKPTKPEGLNIPSSFHYFLVFETPDETLELMFEQFLTHENHVNE